MKLILRQYLANLRERNELDAILPDLLSQMGMNVISRPLEHDSLLLILLLLAVLMEALKQSTCFQLKQATLIEQHGMEQTTKHYGLR